MADALLGLFFTENEGAANLECGVLPSHAAM